MYKALVRHHELTALLDPPFLYNGDNYFMENETDFRQRMSENHSFKEQQIGGYEIWLCSFLR